MSLPVIVLAGRPNVGKSTLFNRLAGKKLAIVHDSPGVTRDWRETYVSLAGNPFYLRDTAGLEIPENDLDIAVQQQTEEVLQQATLIIFLVDALVGLLPDDKTIAQRLRKTGKPVLLVANKAEKSENCTTAMAEFSRIGFDTPLPLSALHGQGIPELIEELESYGNAEELDTTPPDMQLVIMGRPNAGKSTLFNALTKSHRAVVSDVAGTTRDTIAIPLEWEEKTIKLIDTAGLRKKARVDNEIEKFSTTDARRALIFAHVALLVVDASMNMDKQDFTIARQIIEEGRPMVVILNKADTVPQADRKALEDETRYRLQRSLGQVTDVPVLMLSATGKRLNRDRILKACWELYERWNQRIPTAQLNDWLQNAMQRHQAPLENGRRIKIRFATQIKTRPPTFLLFTNIPKALPDAYVRYLEKSLRQTFGFQGVPLRLQLKKGENPYDAG